MSDVTNENIIDQMQREIDAVQWQPIETAPRDGDAILTFDIRSNYYPTVRHWDEGEDGDMAWQPRIRGVFPTHWMPLPEPPQALEQKP